MKEYEYYIEDIGTKILRNEIEQLQRKIIGNKKVKEYSVDN